MHMTGFDCNFGGCEGNWFPAINKFLCVPHRKRSQQLLVKPHKACDSRGLFVHSTGLAPQPEVSLQTGSCIQGHILPTVSQSCLHILAYRRPYKV